MAINRVAGLALPASTKFLVDNVVGKRQINLLAPLALAILAATAIQGMTSYTLTQLLSKAAQRIMPTSAARCRRTSAAFPSPFTTPIKPAPWSRAS